MADDSLLNNPPADNPAPAPADNPAPQGDPAPFDYSGVVTKDGIFSENWRDGLPEELKNDGSLQAIKTLPNLVKSYIHAQHKIGGDKTFVPGKDATEEEIAAYRKAIGVPDAADGYGLAAPAELPNGVSFDEGLAKDFSAKALELGLSKDQAQAIMGFQVAYESRRYEAAEQAARAQCEQTEQKLRHEWGSKFDDKIQQITAACQMFCPELDVNGLGLGRNYEFLMMMSRICDKMGESTIQGVGGKIQDSAKARYYELFNDKNSAFWDASNPGHEAAVAEMMRLAPLVHKK